MASRREPFTHAGRPLRAAAREVLARFAGAAPEEPHRRRYLGCGASSRLLGAQCIEVGPVNASIHKVDERTCA